MVGFRSIVVRPRGRRDSRGPRGRRHASPVRSEVSVIPAAAQNRFRLIEGEQLQSESFAEAVEAGLSRDPKRLDCRFFYDETGSLLFEQICELPEYYLTRSEREILEARSGEIARRFPSDTVLVELGSGSSAKTDLLISAWIAEH
ncbi:MAG: hypothetical protein HKN20_07455, partial [Gemmatimonadetes bacterium]|nr:hypothetical protein [Gemmatimonadota bacterium]